MYSTKLISLPFFTSECGAIVVIRSDDEALLVKLATQLALESTMEQMSTTLADSIYDFSQNIKDLYEDFKNEMQEFELITFAQGSPGTVPLQLLGTAARQKINQRFVGIIGGYPHDHDLNEFDWIRLRTQVNMCGQRIAINFFCHGKKEMEMNMDYDLIADYLLNAEEVNGEIVLSPEEFGGEPFPNPEIRLTMDTSNKWCPYQVKV